MTARFRSKNTDRRARSRAAAALLLTVLVGGAALRAQEPAAKPAEKPGVEPAEKAAVQPPVKPAEKSAEKPADKSAAKPVPREQQWTTQAPNSAASPGPDAPLAVVPPRDYVIGTDDVLSI